MNYTDITMDKIFKIIGITGAACCTAITAYFVADKHHERRETKRRDLLNEEENLRQKKLKEHLKRR